MATHGRTDARTHGLKKVESTFEKKKYYRNVSLTRIFNLNEHAYYKDFIYCLNHETIMQWIKIKTTVTVEITNFGQA